MVEMVNEMFKTGIITSVIPLKILKIFPMLANYEKRVRIYDVMKRYIGKVIDEHKPTNDPEHPRDFTDVYLN